jgi:nitrous oxidase accessory protein
MMPSLKTRLMIFLTVPALAAAKPVDSASGLIVAVQEAGEGATIELAAGTFELGAPLVLKAGMTLKGAGMERTILTNLKSWHPATAALPDPEMKMEGLDVGAYLIQLKRDTAGVTISGMTLQGPQLHGAIFAWFHTGLTLDHLRIRDFLWSGVRTFGLQRAKIRDCEFIDAGGRWEKGQPGVKGGLTGGGLFAVWISDSEIADNRFFRTNTAPEREFYGIKVRQATRCLFHHNSIETNFSMEVPFENDGDNEIDHNFLLGTVSIPKYAGGPLPASRKTFHLHHNCFKDSYSIEFVRNGVEIDHNLFDFGVKQDHGNLISGFGEAASKGPASFHNNLVSNPGRGVIWINEIFDNLEVRNNHIITRTTSTPRTEGLFGFNPGCDFGTITIRDNIIECQGQARPLVRNEESYAAVIGGNALTNVSDSARFSGKPAGKSAGLEAPLKFGCGVHGEFLVDGWKARPPAKRGRAGNG